MAESMSSFGTDFVNVNKGIPKGIGKSLKKVTHKPTDPESLLNLGTAGGFAGVAGTFRSIQETADIKTSNEIGEAKKKQAEEVAALNTKAQQAEAEALRKAREDMIRRMKTTPGRPLLTSLNNINSGEQLLR